MTPPDNATLPTVTTGSSTMVGDTGFTISCEVTSDGGSNVYQRGICWGKNHNPAKGTASVKSSGAGVGSYTITITSLTASTTYYVRAFATNSKGTSYGNEITLTTPCLGSVTDIDGNRYCTVTIGSDTWMTSDLRVTHYSNGTAIPAYTNSTDWSLATTGRSLTLTGVSSVYYNWYAVNDSRGIAPTGWHVATKDEWQALTSGGLSRIKMGGSAWGNGGSNTTGFGALPNGLIDIYAGIVDQDINGYWWTATAYTTPTTLQGIRVYIGDNNTGDVSNRNMRYGMPVRCVKD